MAYKGKFSPKNPKKYKGDVKNIVYRSLLERSYMVKLDANETILQWSSEEVIIPYISPLDNRYHRYFTDFWIKYICGKTGKIKEAIVEIKPDSQTRPPKPSKKKTQRYLKEVQTWLVNDAKWKAALKWCEQNNAEFQLITEKELKPYKKRIRK